MKKNIMLKVAAAALSVAATLPIASGCRINVDDKTPERRERTPRTEYQQDYGYDFYSRDKLTIKILAPINETKFSKTDNLISEIEKATNTNLDV